MNRAPPRSKPPHTLFPDATFFLSVPASAVTIADLFSGLGTFALSVGRGKAVYAAEAARDLVLSLKSAANRAQRKLVVDHRDLFRRPLIPAELNRFEAVILDPPRAGAREQVQQLAQSRSEEPTSELQSL